MKVFFDRMKMIPLFSNNELTIPTIYGYELQVNADAHYWIRNNFAKIVLKATNNDIIDLQEYCEQHNIVYALVEDSGATQETEFNKTLAIGPINKNDKSIVNLLNKLNEFKLY
jgi:peptidyl-tRNA hydrolase